MKAKDTTRRYRNIRQFLIALFIVCTVLVTTAIPVAHASNNTSRFSHMTSRASNSEDSVSCSGDEMSYLGELWPARFSLGGCLVKKIKESGWTVDIVDRISQPLLKNPKLLIGIGVLVVYVESNIY